MNLAFDRSARRLDADGRLHVERSHISKAAINPYYGREIPGYESLGLSPDKVYRLFRDPVELERGASTFARLPVLSEHVPVTVDSPRPDLVVGAIGSEVSFNAPYLDADLCVWDATAIAGIETDKVRELSCAYRYVPVMEPGEFEGQPYDGRMTEIRGNHLALVEIGRAGSDVIVADSAMPSASKECDVVVQNGGDINVAEDGFIKRKESAMKMSKLGKALFAALSAASPVLAADSALPALVGLADRKTFNAKEVKGKLLALDAALDPQQLDNVIDAMLDVEQEPKPVAAIDESPADKLRALLAGKVDDETLNAACALLPTAPAAVDAEGVKPEDVEAAMDGLRKDLREAAEAARDVRAVVGDVIGMDSAADVYGFALDHMKVDRKDVTGTPALRALFKVAAAGLAVAATPKVAQDSGVKIPGLDRFSFA